MSDRNYDFCDDPLNELVDADQRVRELEDELAEAQSKIVRWIPVAEQLPEDRVRVLACGDDPVEGPFTLIGYREPESKFGPAHWHLPCFAEFGPVTCWMPLPEPPEVK